MGKAAFTIEARKDIIRYHQLFNLPRFLNSSTFGSDQIVAHYQIKDI